MHKRKQHPWFVTFIPHICLGFFIFSVIIYQFINIFLYTESNGSVSIYPYRNLRLRLLLLSYRREEVLNLIHLVVCGWPHSVKKESKSIFKKEWKLSGYSPFQLNLWHLNHSNPIIVQKFNYLIAERATRLLVKSVENVCVRVSECVPFFTVVFAQCVLCCAWSHSEVDWKP